MSIGGVGKCTRATASLSAELSRVDFHLSHLYPMSFPICSCFSKVSTLQRMEENLVLASSCRSQYYRLASFGHDMLAIPKSM